MILFLLAAASSAASTTCLPFRVAITPAEQRSDAALLGRAYGHRADPASIGTVLAAREWRIIWGTASDDIAMRVFFLRKSDGSYVYKGRWDTVGVPRSRYLAFARKLAVPAPLARCFADRMASEPSF